MDAGRRALDVALLVVGLVAIWQVVYLALGGVAIASPAETAAHALDLLGRPRFQPHIWESLRAFAMALAISSAGGIAIGVWLGGHRTSGEVAEPILVALYSLPKVTLYPLILLVFGLGLPAKVTFGAIHGIIPVTIFTLNAVRYIKPVHVKAARSMNLSALQCASMVLVPAALPEVVTGLRVGFSLTLLGVLIGEMFASKRGLGFVIVNAIDLDDTKTMMAVTLILAAFAALANAGLLALDRRLHRLV
ncbi:MAG: ABC transporter permease [Pseudomonadota bacterium]